MWGKCWTRKKGVKYDYGEPFDRLRTGNAYRESRAALAKIWNDVLWRAPGGAEQAPDK
jgi:hypothetical protein